MKFLYNIFEFFFFKYFKNLWFYYSFELFIIGKIRKISLLPFQWVKAWDFRFTCKQNVKFYRAGSKNIKTAFQVQNIIYT